MPSESPSVTRSAPLRDQVYDAIEAMVVDHVLVPGERLYENDLADRLQVSRNPVREALNGLSRAGWIVFKPYAGAFVAEQSMDDAVDCFRVRIILEAEAARAAASQVRSGNPKTVRRVTELQAVLEKASTTDDSAALIDANAEFHSRFAALADNHLLYDFIHSLEKRVRWFYGAVGLSSTSASWDEHAALLDAVLAGDADEAARLMTTHIEHVFDAIRTRWADRESTPDASLAQE